MSRETDAIIAVHRSSGAPGIVTDINSLYVHSKTSNHYKNDVTPATPRHPMDLYPEGNVGRAVDFGGKGRRLSEAESLAVFEVFAPFGRDGKLAELYCGQASHCVYRGKWMRWADMPQPTRQAIRSQHMNHIHVAVHAGVFLAPEQSMSAAATPKEEDDMSDALTITYPSGHKTVVTPDGAVKNAGTPFFGSIYDVPADDKKDWVSCFAVTAVDPDDENAGYVLHNDRANSKYAFTPQWWAEHNAKK